MDQLNKEELENIKLYLPLRGKILNTFVNGKSNGEDHATKALVKNDVF